MAKNVDIVERFDAGNKISKSFTDRVANSIGGGKWYQVTSGLDSTIYPEFYNSTQTGVFWPGYKIANSYVAYNTSGRTGLSYLAEVAPDPVQSKDTNAVALQTGELNVIIRRLYQNITYALSEREEKVIANGENFLQPMAEYVAKNLKVYMDDSGDLREIERYSGHQVFDQPVAMDSINKVNAWLAHQGVKHSDLWEGGMFDIWQEYLGDDDNPGEIDEAKNKKYNRTQFMSLAKRLLKNGFNGEGLTPGISANMNLERYGPERGTRGRPMFENPWTERLYKIYTNSTSTVGSGENKREVYGTNHPTNREYLTVSELQESGNAELDYMKTYLQDFERINLTGNTASEQRRTAARVDPRYASIVGLASAPKHALKYEILPRTTGSNTKIEFGLQTSGSHTTNKTKINTTEVEWKAKSSYESGWGFGGTITNEGRDRNRKQWGKFDANASDLQVNQVWEGVTTRTIRPQSEWFKPEIINQAWRNPTADIPTNKSGFKFNSPGGKSNFATASLYYIDGIAYADKFTAKIQGKTQYSDKEFQDKLRDFQQTTKAKAGFSWEASPLVVNHLLRRRKIVAKELIQLMLKTVGSPLIMTLLAKHKL